MKQHLARALWEAAIWLNRIARHKDGSVRNPLIFRFSHILFDIQYFVAKPR